MITREDGTSSITNGRALFTSENGRASYSFGAIIDIENNVTRHIVQHSLTQMQQEVWNF